MYYVNPRAQKEEAKTTSIYWYQHVNVVWKENSLMPSHINQGY